MKLLTYNVHGCVGRGGRPEPAAILEVIERSGAEVVALQEVFGDEWRGSLLQGLQQAGYAGVEFHATMETRRGPYGIAMASKVVPTEVQRIELGGVEPRAAIRFHLEIDGRSIDVCGTHLGLSGSERWSQMDRLDRTLADADDRHDDALQVLMGDLNEWRPRTRFMRTVRRRFGWVSGLPTFPVRWPVIALDRIAVRGSPESVRFTRLDRPPANRASDHRPLLAELSWLGGSGVRKKADE
jgi:endonuclease/exonuclease/phosphatase family metal-dependent hydrolase